MSTIERAREIDAVTSALGKARAHVVAGDDWAADECLNQVLEGVTRLLGWHHDRNNLGRRLLGAVGEDCDPGGPDHDDVHLQLWSGGESEHFRAPMLLVRREDVGQIGWTDPADLVELLAEHGLCRSPEGEAAS